MKILTNENYFEDDEYFSVSSYKKYLACQYNGKLGVYDNHTPSNAMLVGSYVDAYVEGTLDEFKESHPYIFSTRGTTKGELKADFKLAEEICSYIDTNSRLRNALDGDKQSIMVGKIEGVPFKIKMDAFKLGEWLNDMKIMAKIKDKNGNYIDFLSMYGYLTQMAVYQEIAFQNTGIKHDCNIVAVSKTDPIDSVIIYIPQYYLDIELDKVKRNVKELYDVKMGIKEPIRCEVCSKCISTREKTPVISYANIVNRMDD